MSEPVAPARAGVGRSAALRFLAFYLPQYHPIPENDEWWGKGFTEWRNVARARPLFAGHYQPHIPADLGFYDLRLAETRIAQAELAARYGIGGFCYYHYWFNGRRLLERPFEEVLASGEPDLPFCLCWANENWTRVWDGSEDQVLLAQDYGDEEDDRRHLRALAPAFADPRYIRVDGRPVFLVYRTGRMPSPARTAERWRDEAQRLGLGELYLCRVEAFDEDPTDPRPLGFDANVEFHPHGAKLGPRHDPNLAAKALRQIFRPKHPFRFNAIHSYEAMVELALAEAPVPWTRFRGVTPAWDNSARRSRDARILLGSTPERYRDWLVATVEGFTPPTPEENLLFVNAWNEWAEGNHLEPDLRWGHAYLEAHLAVRSAWEPRGGSPA